MTDDQFWRIVTGSVVLGLLAAFRPQVVRLWRRFGYREENEVDTTSPKRVVFVMLAVLGFFVIGGLISLLSNLFK